MTARTPEPTAALTVSDVRKVARLARLAIPEDRLEDHRIALAAVLGYVDRLRTLDLAGVEPLAHVGEEPHRLRADVPGTALPTETLMSMAPDSMAPFVRIPKVLGEGAGA